MEEREIHLRDYLLVANKRKGTIATFFLVITAVTFLAVFADDSKPVYRASTKVLIEKNLSASLTGQRYSYGGYDPDFLQTQTQIIRSEGVAEKVVDMLGAEKMYNSFFSEKEDKTESFILSARKWISGVLRSFKEMIGIKSPGSPAMQKNQESSESNEEEKETSKAEILKSSVRGGISVEPIEGTQVVSISYTSSNPVLSRKIANSVANAYIEELLDKRMQASSHSIEWMKKKAELQRKKLEKAENKLHQYKKKHDIVTVEDRLAILPERLSKLSEKLTQAETQRKELESVYNQVKNKSDRELENLSVISASVSIDEINKKILLAEQKVSELSKKYGPKHPKMIAAKDELSGLKRKKHEEIQKAVQRIKNEYLLAKSQEKQFR